MAGHSEKNRNKSEHGPVHEVNRPTYSTFAKSMGSVVPPMFPECCPTLEGETSRPDAQERINEKLQVKRLRLEPPSKKKTQVKESRVEPSRKRCHEKKMEEKK